MSDQPPLHSDLTELLKVKLARVHVSSFPRPAEQVDAELLEEVRRTNAHLEVIIVGLDRLLQRSERGCS